MKKLLLITNVFVFSAFIGSCQSNPKSVTTNETKPKTNVTPTKVDTLKSNSQTSTSGAAGTNGGIKKDTTSASTKITPVNHSAPNQAQIDSLKKVKTKGKNQKKKK